MAGEGAFQILEMGLEKELLELDISTQITRKREEEEQGEQGDQGDQGEQGEQGKQGDQGEPGKQGEPNDPGEPEKPHSGRRKHSPSTREGDINAYEKEVEWWEGEDGNEEDINETDEFDEENDRNIFQSMNDKIL